MEILDNIHVLTSKLMEVDTEIASKFDPVRKERLLRNNNPNGKKEIYTSGVLIEKIRPENAVINYNSKGKPYFTDENGINCKPYFNITHSNDKVICIYSDCYILGVDYESSERVMKPETARRLCTPKEHKVFMSFEDRTMAGQWLLKLFTQKEAYSKLLGAGMSIEFTELETDELSQSLTTLETEDGFLSIAYKKA